MTDKTPKQKTKYIYLHGFASSPNSTKAQQFKTLFAQQNIPLLIPDLNQNDFYHLTITRQIKQIATYLENDPAATVLIGSSLGGLTSAWLGEKYPQIKQLILLAPAFGFFSHYLNKLDKNTLEQWKNKGELPIYHYGVKQELPLSYQFFKDGQKYDQTHLKRSIPTFIFHGKKDVVIPIDYSYQYAKSRTWVNLIELDSDHGLTDKIQEIWSYIMLIFNTTVGV
ncbi:MAG: YqiA/YcfP family alpha/beta fold hydrolase [Crocosphaera sp.]